MAAQQCACVYEYMTAMRKLLLLLCDCYEKAAMTAQKSETCPENLGKRCL